MFGAIAGDIIGSVYEHHPIKTKEFPLFQSHCHFTDDTVLTVAIAKAILDDQNYRQAVGELGRRYPRAGYGKSFKKWLHSSDPQPYNSWGNGAAMRVSPIGFAFDTVDAVLREAKRTAEISHNHPEGIKGAQAVALAVYLARTKRDRALIRQEVVDRFGYNLNRTVDEIRPFYHFDVSCQGTVPEAIIAFLDSNSYEDAVRNAISLGGDSDTLACITGGIAEAYYGPASPDVLEKVKEYLTPELWQIMMQFYRSRGMEMSNNTLAYSQPYGTDKHIDKNATALKQVTIFASGTCIDNPGPGGYGVVLKYGVHKKELSGGFRQTTDSRVKIMAAIIGLEALKEKCSVTIHSDSQWLVDGILKGQANESKERDDHADLWNHLLELCDQHIVRFVGVNKQLSEDKRAHNLSILAAQGIDSPPSPSSGKAKTIKIEVVGTTYVWTGEYWYDEKTYAEPPQIFIGVLNKRLTVELAKEDANIFDVYTLLERASKARVAGQHHRAEKLARRCLKLEPDSEPALAVLCAALRAQGRPQKALNETRSHSYSDHIPLLTSRAAALCDLKKWEEAKKTIGRALAIGDSQDAFNVMQRIKANRPDLY